MRILTRKSSSETGLSRSRLIIGLLIGCLLLVLGLAWQAHQTMQTHLATATKVLQDYAMLVADEYSRRAMGQLGYYGYYTYVSMLRRRALEESAFPFQIAEAEAESPVTRARLLVSYLFFVDMSNTGIQTSGKGEPGPGVGDYLYQRSSSFLQEPLSESGYAIDHVTLSGQSHTFILSKVEGKRRVFGFEVDRHELSSWLKQVFEKDVLLPKSLADGVITNEFIYLRFVDDGGHVLFESRQSHDPNLLVQKRMNDEYEGIFKTHTISAAIDPMIAGSLVIGGLPRSRLPVLFVVILVTVGLLIAAIRQLQREHALMKIRTNFVSEVSHELRTPLTQIRMFVETLLLDRFRTEEDKHRALEIINRESQRLIHLVENVLRFSDGRGDQRKLSLDNRILAPIIEGVVDVFQPLAESAGVTVCIELDPEAAAPVDIDALRQILLNLLDNAVKYGPSGQQVCVALTRLPGCVEISVSDQGPGIPRVERERIWGDYYRLDRERRSSIAGTGIGLAVVHELVARHGGTSSVKDTADGGALFVVEFPVAAHVQQTSIEIDRPITDPNERELP